MTDRSSSPLLRLLPILIGVLLVSLGCDRMSGQQIEGSGTATTEERTVDAFTAIEMNTTGRLILEQGEQRVELRGDDNILPRIITEIEDGALAIGTEENVSLDPEVPLEYRIRMPNLEAVQLDGSGDIEMSPFTVERLVLEIDGSGTVRTRELTGGSVLLEIDGSGDGFFPGIDTESLEIEIDGSGSIEASGRADAQMVDIAGSGNFIAPDLTGRTVQIRVAGSGDAQVGEADSLRVRISGSGDIRYRGSPVIDQRISGSGSVRPLGSSDK